MSDGPLDSSAVAALLIELGQRIELAGDSPYKARAYRRAAESLLTLTEPLADVVAAGRLRAIPGVGAAIEEKVLAFHQNGTHRTLERLRGEVPASALELLAIPGLPTQKVRAIQEKLGITDLAALEAACRAERLADVKGLGPALQKKILQGIGIMRRSGGQRHLHHAADLLEAAAANLRVTHPQLKRVEIAGDFRRGAELVQVLRLVAETDGRGEGIRTVPINDEIEVIFADPGDYGAALLLATGSAEHVEALRERAGQLGLALDEAGLHRGGAPLACPDEPAVYAALGLPFVPPELREGGEEVAMAAAGTLPRLVTEADLRGILHCHTLRSDGINSLAEMAEATRLRGYGYFGVADHSQSAGYAGGLSVDEVLAQHDEADALNAGYADAFRILKGIEADILVDGSLDYPDEVLARFDFVVASVHSRFALDEAAQTERILRAVANRHTTILGHMTGRMLLRREGYELDIDRVLQGCAEHGVAVEINANPHRLDLDWRWHRRALELGCTLSINPDAHSVAELDYLRWGVLMARKGGVPAERVLNCMELPALLEALQRKQSPRSAPRRRRK